ncbi:hypothetical protein Tco_0550030, partial [Tanacetum coccineum]
NKFQVPNGFGEQENLEEFLMNDEVNGVLSDSESEIEIRLEDFSGNMEDLLDEQAS